MAAELAAASASISASRRGLCPTSVISLILKSKSEGGKNALGQYLLLFGSYLSLWNSIRGSHHFMSPSGVCVWRLLHVLLMFLVSRDPTRSPQLRVPSSLVELKPRAGPWRASSVDMALYNDNTTYISVKTKMKRRSLATLVFC